MIVQPIDYVVLPWLALCVLSAVYVAIDQFTGNPEAAVMKWGFVLVTLYTGPVGLLLYVMADKEPRPGTHAEFIAPLWKQAVGSTVHCVAGDATGIIVAAVCTALVGLPMWGDLLVEYACGFIAGLLIFQALFMRNMMGGSYLLNVRRSFLPEWISMNTMMAAMAPVMAFAMMSRDMRAMWPTEPLFWFVMSLGITAGFILAYPSNLWLVGQRMKHGLMTVRATKQMDHASHAMHESHAMPAGHAERESHRSLPDGASPHPTPPQLAAVTGFSMMLLMAGLFVPAAFVNLGIHARDVRGFVMPPGMIMTPETSAETMHDMSAAEWWAVRYTAPPQAHGDQPLEPRIENGVKVFDLDASVIRWNILPGVTVTAYAYNHRIPGPRLEVTEGDRVRINLVNHLPESTTIHWHGLVVPNAMDGPANITQAPVPPGGHFSYEFTVRQHGTYLYHSHDHPDRQQALGLYGAFIIRPRDPTTEVHADLEYVVQLQEWLERDGLTYPAMPMNGGFPNYFTINGKAYPATDTLHMRVGETLKLRLIGSNSMDIHPMHMHGGPFTVVARDGVTLAPATRYEADVVNVAPGQRYDVVWPARLPGKWLLHCHISHHTTNNNMEQQGGGGLMLIVDVAP